MSDATVTEADREAVSALLQSLADKQKFAAVFSLVPADLYPHFAAHAARAVEAERKRCVEVLRAEAEKYQRSAENFRDCGWSGVAGDARLWKIAASTLADQLQKGAG